MLCMWPVWAFLSGMPKCSIETIICVIPHCVVRKVITRNLAQLQIHSNNATVINNVFPISLRLKKIVNKAKVKKIKIIP